MNKVWEIGRLTKEPEIRYTSKKNGNGEEESTVTASYTLAVARGYRHEDGQQDADFFRCVAFGKNAEFAEKYLHKGTKIAISGHLHSGSYTNKDGVKVYNVNIVVEQHEFIDFCDKFNTGQGNMYDTPIDFRKFSSGYLDGKCFGEQKRLQPARHASTI